jgi:isopentenyl diphosphate isomerase/L-lactate dehydrogenase-like FMN-dependent dehydrogenase
MNISYRYQRIWFRPRILRDVTNIDYKTTMLGKDVSHSPSHS